MTLEELKVLITAETSGLRSGLSDVKRQLKSASGNVNSSTSSMTNSLKKMAMGIAAAFSVKKIIDFSKRCVDLGSDLTEVQNVVDVTFPSMSKQVDSFAQSAASNFGLSETMAKKFTGTFGAMAKSFGFSEQSAYNMSTALTGLSGDVASFYNISQDEAYTKLKSVFTGETETLKELGIVMTQNALDAYAMTNGYGKTTDQMSEAEKVALRYAFVQDKLKLATGDFSRTQDSWANQTRLLKLQFDSLMASIGQGLIAALAPALKGLNALIGKLAIAAEAFKNFMNKVTGKTDEDTSGMSQNIDSAVNSTGDLSQGLDNTAQSAKKAKKEIKGLMGFDEINKLGNKEDDTDSTAVPQIAPAKNLNMDKANSSMGQTSALLDGIIDKVKELANQFQTGFKEGLGADFNASIERTKEHLSNIGENLKDIFTDEDVQEAVNTFVDKYIYNFGKVVGSFASIGQSIVENIVGGFDIYLEGAKGRIKGWLVRMFNIEGESLDIIGNFNQAIANVFEVLRSDVAKGITSDIISVISDTFMGASELFAKLGRDILDTFTAPFIDNQENIKQTILDTLQPVEDVYNTIAGVVSGWWDTLNQMYDEHIAPMFDSFSSGFSEIAGLLLEKYNQYILPVIQDLAPKVSDLWENHIGPALDKVSEFIGKIADMIKDIWNNVTKPFIEWIINNVVPVLAPIFKKVVEIIIDVASTISDVFGGVVEILGGVVDFISGVFTGNWSKVWQGVVEIFGGIWDTLKSIIKTPLNWIIDAVNWAIGKINSALTFSVPDWDFLPDNVQGKTFGISIPEIPRLAQGGYVQANMPQLAMIGDNTHEGEIVAPESKIAEAVAKGIANALGSIKNISNSNSPTELVIKIGEETIGRLAVNGINSLTKMNGASGLII